MGKSMFDTNLFQLKDEDYKVFNQKLVPNISLEDMIGVRIPALRKLAKKLFEERREACFAFMKELPHRYFEENNLHAFMIEQIKDVEESLEKTEEFLPYIDNWQTCDVFSPKIFKKYPDKVLELIRKCLNSEYCYTLRYGIGLLLSYFLEDEFKPCYLDWVADKHSEEYYVNMMIAWYFSEALVKQWDDTISVLEKRKLEIWTHNKAIQKAIESRRISDEKKSYLRGLKIKDVGQ